MQNRHLRVRQYGMDENKKQALPVLAGLSYPTRTGEGVKIFVSMENKFS